MTVSWQHMTYDRSKLGQTSFWLLPTCVRVSSLLITTQQYISY